MVNVPWNKHPVYLFILYSQHLEQLNPHSWSPNIYLFNDSFGSWRKYRFLYVRAVIQNCPRRLVQIWGFEESVGTASTNLSSGISGPCKYPDPHSHLTYLLAHPSLCLTATYYSLENVRVPYICVYVWIYAYTHVCITYIYIYYFYIMYIFIYHVSEGYVLDAHPEQCLANRMHL